MRINLVILILILGLMQVSASTFGQRITFRKHNVKLGTVFKEIQRQTGYDVLVSGNTFKKSLTLDVNFVNASVDEVLKTIIGDRELTYTVERKNIVISAFERKPSFNERSFAVPINIEGRVVDERGEPLAGSTILIKGTKTMTTSNGEGIFKFTKIEDNAVLVVSYTGYITQEIPINRRNSISIKLVEDLQKLNEVVVVAYGTQDRASLTGSISVVDKAIIENRPVTNALAALQGTAAGLSVTRTNGQPGEEGYDLQIRGISSVNGGEALVVIDDIPGGDLQSLNPNDIESISILKDAAASAIYGARAAAGVVLVTTKKGTAEKPVINYTGLYGLKRPINIPERIHSWEEAEMANIASVNAGQRATFTEEQIGWLKDPDFNFRLATSGAAEYEFYYDLDQTKILLRDYTPSQNHNLSLAQKGLKDNLFLSLGYFDQKGVFKFGPDKNSRLNARINYFRSLTKAISLDTRISYAKSDLLAPSLSPTGDNNLLYQLYQLKTLYPIFTPETNDTKYSSHNSSAKVYSILKDGGERAFRQDDISASLNLKAQIAKGLSLRTMYSPSLRFTNDELAKRTIEYWNRVRVGSYYNNPNSFSRNTTSILRNNLQFLLDYDYTFNRKNKIHLLLGASSEDFRSKGINASTKNLSTNDLFSLNFGDPAQNVVSDNIQTWAMRSYFGRLNYNFNNRLLLDFNLRYDGSSKLAPSNRWEAFPSVSGAWRVNNEKWFSRFRSVIDMLKIRGSWGQLGNSNGVIGNYDYIALINKGEDVSRGDYPFNNTPSSSYFQRYLSSDQKKWETIETMDVGIDMAFFKNRLSVSSDYFIKRNKNMLAPLQVSSIIGISTSTYNVADLKTWGWEVSVKWTDRVGKNFSYFVNANLSDYQNKILKYDGQQSVSSGINRIVEGMPYNSYYGYVSEGYFQTPEQVSTSAFQDNRTGPGDIKYTDIDGDGRISGGLNRLSDHGDLVYLGSPEPRYVYGLNFGFNVKGFDFSAFFQGVGKRNVLMFPKALVPFMDSWRSPWKDNMDYWTPENPDAQYPRLYLGGAHNSPSSTHWIMNGAYLRLKNVQLGYTLPYQLTKRAKINKMRIFFTGQDLWEVSGMWLKYFDAEHPNNASFSYPFFRTYSMGLNIIL